MPSRVRLVVLMMAAVLAMAACTTNGNDNNDDGTRLAFGLHEMTDGTVVGLGVLEWVELEGGFYALTGAPEHGGNIAVIANPEQFEAELRALKGATVQVTGTLFEGASTRMAGPEIIIDSIEEITDTPGPAD